MLSKNCIFDILNNKINSKHNWNEVVNCFQKIVSLIFWTTNAGENSNIDKLWIAFKKLYLWYSEQLIHPVFLYLGVVNCFQKIVSLIFWTTDDLCFVFNACCELLSKNCIFDILNNSPLQKAISRTVVNCFQKIVSLIFWTTKRIYQTTKI